MNQHAQLVKLRASLCRMEYVKYWAPRKRSNSGKEAMFNRVIENNQQQLDQTKTEIKRIVDKINKVQHRWLSLNLKYHKKRVAWKRRTKHCKHCSRDLYEPEAKFCTKACEQKYNKEQDNEGHIIHLLKSQGYPVTEETIQLKQYKRRYSKWLRSNRI